MKLRLIVVTSMSIAGLLVLPATTASGASKTEKPCTQGACLKDCAVGAAMGRIYPCTA